MSKRTLQARAPETLPGPRNALISSVRFQRDPLEFIDRVIADHGDIARFRLGPIPIVLVNNPDYVRNILVDHAASYERDSVGHRVARTILGNGLATVAGGDSWLSQRRMMQPAFHKAQLALLYQTIQLTVLEWADGLARHARLGKPIDMTAEMTELALRVVLRALFRQDLAASIMHEFSAAVADANRELTAYVRSPYLPLAVPTPGHRRLRRSLQQIDDIVYRIIDRHDGATEDGADLLSMIMSARDPETGAAMNRLELRDEVFTMLFAGHETSANTLSWIWYLLAKYPAHAERAQEEVDSVLAGSTPGRAELAQLPWMNAVIDETLRLYPPGWQGFRSAREDDYLGGYHIPRGTSVLYSSYHLHRNPACWDNPEHFSPERFLPGSAPVQRGSYIPFGEGRHLCIGKPLAMIEIRLVMAAVLQRYRLTLMPGAAPAKPAPLITLGMKEPLWMLVTER